MAILALSGPESSISKRLLEMEIGVVISVTPSDVFVSDCMGNIASGRNIKLDRVIKTDIPTLKTSLLKAYPLIDRWVSRGQSISTTLGELLEYTVALVQIIGNYQPKIAVLETGAPHHLFSYCLDVALNYCGVKIYYLYGNAYDSRCLLVEGIFKINRRVATDYTAELVFDELIADIQSDNNFVAGDSIESLSPMLHKQRAYALILFLRSKFITLVRKYVRSEASVNATKICLELPSITFPEVWRIFRSQGKYLKSLAASAREFPPEVVNSNDIVYVGHMLPEATSFPECIDYPDELDVLIDLKNRFPESSIYYREHPAIDLYAEFGHVHLQGLHKCLEFQNQLCRLGIVQIPHGIHLAEIRSSGCAFATKTGRVAVENSLLGLFTLVYGYPFYGVGLPLTLHASCFPEVGTLEDARNIATRTPHSTQDVRSYLLDRFTGSIVNPGISVKSDPSCRPLFEESLCKVIKELNGEALS